MLKCAVRSTAQLSTISSRYICLRTAVILYVARVQLHLPNQENWEVLTALKLFRAVVHVHLYACCSSQLEKDTWQMPVR